MNYLSMDKNSCGKSQGRLKYEVEIKSCEEWMDKPGVVQGSKEKSGSEVALEGEMGVGRRWVAKNVLVGE